MSEKREAGGVTGEQAFTVLAFQLGSRSLRQILDTTEAAELPGVDGHSVAVGDLSAVIQVHEDGVDFSIGGAMWQIDRETAHVVTEVVTQYELNSEL